MGLRMDLRTILNALLIPTQFRLLLKESQKLRKFYRLVHLHTRTLIAYQTFRILLLEAVYRREVKELQLSLATLPKDQKTSSRKKMDKKSTIKSPKDAMEELEANKNSSGKLVEEYFLNSIYDQQKRIGTFLDFMDNEDIVIWDLVTDVDEES